MANKRTEELYALARASADEIDKIPYVGTDAADIKARVYEARIACALIGVLVEIEQRLSESGVVLDARL